MCPLWLDYGPIRTANAAQMNGESVSQYSPITSMFSKAGTELTNRKQVYTCGRARAKMEILVRS